MNTTKKTASDYAINLINSNEKDNSSLAQVGKAIPTIANHLPVSYSKSGFHGININLCFNRKTVSRKIRN